jgi:hypothetical protein
MTRTRIIVAVLVIALVVIILGSGITACQKIISQKAQIRVTSGQLGASQASGTDAVNTAGNVAANEAATADLTRTNEEDIRNAKGADVGVDPAVRAAGVRAFCRRRSAANDPKCRVQQPAP